MVMTDETVVDVLEVAEKVLVEVSERVKVRARVSQVFFGCSLLESAYWRDVGWKFVRPSTGRYFV